MHVVVVGGGLMGLSAAWALQKRGAAITVVEQGPLPNPKGSSVDSQRAIRRPYGSMVGYMRMVDAAYAAWDALWDDLGERLYQETGTLITARGRDVWVADSVRAMTADGLVFESVSPTELAGRWPHIAADGVTQGYYLSDGGLLLADRIIEAMARYVADRGADLLTEATVAAVDTDAPSATLTDGRTIGADALVVAAGPWIGQLLPDFAGRAQPSRQVLVYLDPPAAQAESWNIGPMLLDVGSHTGAFVLPPAGGAPGKIGIHTQTPSGDPNDARQVLDADIEAALKAADVVLNDRAGYRVARTLACYYTVAAGERFIVEPLDGKERSWVMTGFSGHGFKFGPVLGQQVAAALCNDRASAEVSAYCAGEIT